MAAELTAAGVTVRLGDGDGLPDDVDLLVVAGVPSPRRRSSRRRWRAMSRYGVNSNWPGACAPTARRPVAGDHGNQRQDHHADARVHAASRRTAGDRRGQHRVSLVDAVLGDDLDAIAVEVGAPQLPFWHTVSPLAAVCPNVAEDHIDHFGTFDNYAAAKARIYDRCQVAAVYNRQDERTRTMVADAQLGPGLSHCGIHLGTPRPVSSGSSRTCWSIGPLADPTQTAVEIAAVGDVRPAAPHNVANAPAAAALARSLRRRRGTHRRRSARLHPAGHRIATVGTVAEVAYVGRLEGHQRPCRRPRPPAGMATERSGSPGSGQGPGVRRTGGRDRRSDGRGRAAGPGSGRRRSGSGPTRAGCAGRCGEQHGTLGRWPRWLLPPRPWPGQATPFLLAPGCASWTCSTVTRSAVTDLRRRSLCSVRAVIELRSRMF